MTVPWCGRQLFRRSLHCSSAAIDHPIQQCKSHILRISRQPFATNKSLPSHETPKTILYSYWHSSCSWRVRIALNYKEIPYETKAINLAGEQQGDEYRLINPMQQVPTLQIDGHSIIESVAIMEYLEETRPQRPLLPPDPYKRAKVREVVGIICSDIQPLQNLSVRKYVGKEKQKEWAQHWIDRGFCALEKLLATGAGQYCVGDGITMADCCLLPQVFNAKVLKMDMSKYPIILRISSDLETIPAFIAANPTNQPDFQPGPTKNK